MRATTLDSLGRAALAEYMWWTPGENAGMSQEVVFDVRAARDTLDADAADARFLIRAGRSGIAHVALAGREAFTWMPDVQVVAGTTEIVVPAAQFGAGGVTLTAYAAWDGDVWSGQATSVRRRPDAALAVAITPEQAAVGPGDSVRVTVTTRDGRRFASPIVIAADGVHSVVSRRLGMNRGWAASAVALDMMEETPRSALRDLDPSTLWVAYGFNPAGSRTVKGTRAAEGYAYIFPKRDHVNIGIGYLLSHYREAVAAPPYELQRGFVAELRNRGIVAGDSVRQNFTPFLIPVGGPLRRPGRGRVLLAGDAGGFVNGLTAEGIYYAMVSGELAAQTVAATADVSRLAPRYRRACDHEIGTELRDSVLVQRYLFADRRRIARVIDGAHREPAITRSILDFAAGRRTYKDLRRRLLAGSPLLAGRLVWEHLRKNFVVQWPQPS